jgi:hypothetical protein
MGTCSINMAAAESVSASFQAKAIAATTTLTVSSTQVKRDPA